jgi:hypothetical protein
LATKLTRRAWLARTAAGAAALALEMARLRQALALGLVEPGVNRVRGDARVNGKPAKRGMVVRPGDVLTTGADAEFLVVVGRDAFLVRSNSRIELTGQAAQFLVTALRVVTGALLSVYAPGEKKRVQTPAATVGIRGSGLYVEIEKTHTYVCLCYGEAELVPVDDPKQAEVVRTRHHDEPRYIYPKGMPRMIEKAPVINHTDAELILLESLVGRKPPFKSAKY